MNRFEDQLMPHLTVKMRPQARQENVVTDGSLRVSVLTGRLFRVETGSFTDEATQAVWFRDLPAVAFTAAREEDFLIIRTDAVTLSLNKKNIEESIVTFPDGKQAKLDNTGNLLGTFCTLDTSDGRYLRMDPSVTIYDREHIPLETGVCSRSGVAVYDDSKSLLLLQDGQLSQRKEGSRDLYVFAYGHDYAGAVKALYSICGPTPVIPRFALGNWWSRYWPYTQQEYLDVMDNFSDEGIPISVAVIDMDWHHVQIDQDFGITEKGLDDEIYGGTSGWTGYTWNETLFPDHCALLQDLHERGMHVTLNLHPALGIRWFEKPYRATAEAMGLDPEEKRPVSFQIENPKFVNNYLNLVHHPMEDEGVDFWWIDWQQGTTTALKGLDPLWALNHYHYLDNQERKGRGLILSRYAGIGSHRYPLGFSGDIHMDWEFLDYMPYFTATAANAGYGWWSHDIGGHHRGERDEELYLRWLQFGVFSPINRLHCCPSVVTSKEPWTLTVPFRAAAGEWFRFRHSLIPYLYAESWRNTLEGRPLIRPMYYGWPEEEAAYEADHQYLFGDLLAAPITAHSAELGIAKKRVWLPEGRWTDIFSGGLYQGGRWIDVYRDAGAMPVFAGEGTVLPLDPDPDNRCETPSRLDVLVFNGSSACTMWEGEKPDRVEFVTRQEEAGVQKLMIENQSIGREFHVFFKNVEEGTVALLVNHGERPVTMRHNRCLQAIFSLAPGEQAELTVSFQEPDWEKVLRAQILACFLMLPQRNTYKDAEWEKTRSFTTEREWEAWIDALALPETGKGMLRERVHMLG